MPRAAHAMPKGLFALCSATALAGALAACGPDDAKQADAMSLLDGTGPLDWSMSGGGPFADNYDFGDYPPLPAAAPMTTRVSMTRHYAPSFNYGARWDRYSDEPYEDVYYDDDPDEGSYAWLGMASLLGDAFGDAPPDYYFDYEGVDPWVWQSSDGWYRYAEPIDVGYRYYYYEPEATTPFLVRDPYYSYGYRGDRLVVIYDNSGRVVDGARAFVQRRAAQDYFARARNLYAAQERSEHYGVSAPLWVSSAPIVARDQSYWHQARGERPNWRDWNKAHATAIAPRWTGERAARAYATDRFARWQNADFRGPAPQLGREARAAPQVRRAAFKQARWMQALQQRQDAGQAIDRHQDRPFAMTRQAPENQMAGGFAMGRLRADDARRGGESRQLMQGDQRIAARRMESNDRRGFARSAQVQQQQRFARPQMMEQQRGMRAQQQFARPQQLQQQQRAFRAQQQQFARPQQMQQQRAFRAQQQQFARPQQMEQQRAFRAQQQQFARPQRMEQQRAFRAQQQQFARPQQMQQQRAYQPQQQFRQQAAPQIRYSAPQQRAQVQQQGGGQQRSGGNGGHGNGHWR